jgi:hypothetical protein
MTNPKTTSEEWDNFIKTYKLQIGDIAKKRIENFISTLIIAKQKEVLEECIKVINKYEVKKQPLCEQNVLLNLIKVQLEN